VDKVSSRSRILAPILIHSAKRAFKLFEFISGEKAIRMRSRFVGLQLRVVQKRWWEDDVNFSLKQPEGRLGQQIGDLEYGEEPAKENPRRGEEGDEDGVNIGDNLFLDTETL